MPEAAAKPLLLGMVAAALLYAAVGSLGRAFMEIEREAFRLSPD